MLWAVQRGKCVTCFPSGFSAAFDYWAATLGGVIVYYVESGKWRHDAERLRGQPSSPVCFWLPSC